MLRNNTFIVLGSSLIILFTGLAFFDFTVAAPRFFNNQIVHFKPNTPILHFHGRIYRIDPDGTTFVKDSAGAIIKTDLKQDNLSKNQIVVISGKMGGQALLHVTQVEAYSLRFWKFFISILGLLFVIWKLFKSLEWTQKGLRIKILNSNQT